MKIIKFKKKFTCKKCKIFICEKKEDGYTEFNSKCKISTNGASAKVKCTCGEIYFIEL